MVLETITNISPDQVSGFTAYQFRKLDGLYLRAASRKTLTYRSVECDFDEGIATYTYYKSAHHAPYIQFLIRRVGPRTVMYEIYLEKKGRILKSGVFEKAYQKLRDEIQFLS